MHRLPSRQFPRAPGETAAPHANGSGSAIIEIARARAAVILRRWWARQRTS